MLYLEYREKKIIHEQNEGVCNQRKLDYINVPIIKLIKMFCI